MTKLFIPIIALSLFLIFAHQSLATGYRSTRPIYDTNGNSIGNVVSYQQNDYLYTDYDFNNSSSCKLQSINTNQGGHFYSQTVSSDKGDTLSRDLNTYITPRDAVLAFDTSDQSDYSASQFSSTLKFNCNDNLVTASTTSSQRYYLPHRDYYRPTLTPQPTRTPSPTPTSSKYPSEYCRTHGCYRTWYDYSKHQYCSEFVPPQN